MGGGEDENNGATETVKEQVNTDTPPRGSPDVTEGETVTDTAEQTETETGDVVDLTEVIGGAPSGIQVTNTQLNRVDQGDAGARVTGVVENTGNNTYEELEIQATLFDDTDDVLGTYFDNTERAEAENVAPLEPGEQWEFSVDFPRADLGNAVRYRLDVDAEIDNQVYDPADGTGTPSAYAGIGAEVDDNTDPNFQIVSNALAPVDGTPTVSGEVKNVSSETANSVEVEITLYGSNNNEIGVFTSTLQEDAQTSQIPPGEVWQFVVPLEGVDMQNVERYVISVDSDLA